MKNIIIIIGVGLCLNACSLDTIPTDRYVESSFWQTEEQVEAGLTACYNTLRDTYLFGGTASAVFNETITPNAYMYDNTYGFGVIGKGMHTLSNSTVINEKWGSCYKGIGRCNTFLKEIVTFDMSEDLKNQKIAEVKFLRALYYFELTNYYGDAPLILDPPNVDTQKDLPRNAKSEIQTQIVKDLTEAAAVLPDGYSSSGDLGRPTSGAAKALLSRVYLYNSMWNEAEKMAKEVIASGKYSLYPNYRQIFSRDNENNSEVIFDVQFLNPDYKHGMDLIMRQYNTCAPLLDLVKAYEMSDGTPYVDSKPLYEDRDPRFYQTIVYPGSQYMGLPVANDRFKFTGYTFKKFSVYDEEYVPEYDYNDINYIVIRYADILLTYAEARNEGLAAPDKEVYDALNQIRDRETVKMPLFDISKGYTKEQMRDIIRHERRIELAGEGLYYFDILRWKTAKDVMNGPIYKYDASTIEVRVFENKDYLWPVPETEIKENPNLLPNNPGW